MPHTTTLPCRKGTQGTAHATQPNTPALPDSMQSATREATQGATEPPSVVQQLVVYGLGSPEESRVSRYQVSPDILLKHLKRSQPGVRRGVNASGEDQQTSTETGHA